VRIGLSMTSAFGEAEQREPRRGAAAMVARARAAAGAGFDSLFVGDHHVTAVPYYQNSPMLGRLLAEWPQGTAGALYLLPLWHPVLLAEQIATLASIAPGPFVMQCGLGGDVRQGAGMGVPNRERVPRFEASLEILRALWAGDTVTRDGPWSIEAARISPLPPQGVEVWIGAQVPAAIDRAARLGEGWLASPSLTYAQAADDVNRYRQACAEHGRTPRAVAIRRDFYIGASAEAARRVTRAYVEAGYRGFDPAALLIGSVEQVAAEIDALAALGYSDVILRNLVADQDEALAAIERVAEVRGLLGASA